MVYKLYTNKAIIKNAFFRFEKPLLQITIESDQQLKIGQNHDTHLELFTVFGFLLRGLFNKVRDEDFQRSSG